MGIGAIAAYGKAWLAADESQKDKILELMKEAAGMTETMTRTAGLRQNMRLAEAKDERVRQLFPTVEDQAKTTLAKSQTELGTLQRTEAETVESRTREREELGGDISPTIMNLAKAFAAVLQTNISKEMVEQKAPAATAGQAVSEARAGETAADLAEAGDRARLGRGTFVGTVLAEEAEDRATIGEAGVRQETARQQTIQEIPRVTTQAQRQAAETAIAQQKIQATIATELADIDYPRLVASAQKYLVSVGRQQAAATLEKTLAEVDLLEAKATPGALPTDRAASKLEILRYFMGEQKFREHMLRTADIERGDIVPMGEILSRLSKLEQIEVDLQQAFHTGADVLSMLQGFANEDEEIAEMVGIIGAGKRQLDSVEILAGIQDLKTIYQGMLNKDWERGDYNQLLRQGKRVKQYTDDDINDMISLIESGANQGGTLGNLAAEYGIGITPAKRADVIHGITGIMNLKSIKPVDWLRALKNLRDDEEIRPGLEGRQGLISRWDQQSYNAASAILQAAQWHIEYPGVEIPTAEQPALGVQQ